MRTLIIKSVKKAVVATAYNSGLAKLFGSIHSSKLFCVGYHSVWSDKNKKELHRELYSNISIKVEDFEEQILFMKKNNHTFINFSDLSDPNTKKLKKATIIFFDDGFKDILVNALPILQKHNIPATVFVTTGLIERTHFLWTLKVRHIMSRSGLKNFEVEKKILELKKMSMAERDKKIKDLEKEYALQIQPEKLSIFLDWNEVNDLKNGGFEIGSHGVKHEKLIELSGNELLAELSESKKILEEKIGQPVFTVSYPYGRYNIGVEKAAQSTGYFYGMTTESGWNKIDDVLNDPYKMKRIEPNSGDKLTSFAVKLYMNI